MCKFPSEKHFCSWLGLALKYEISGAKVLTLAPHIIPVWGLRLVQCGCGGAFGAAVRLRLGALYRRLRRARLGPAQATVATAHALARVVYRMLTLAPHIIPVWGLRLVQCRCGGAFGAAVRLRLRRAVSAFARPAGTCAGDGYYGSRDSASGVSDAEISG